jgi:4-amino-4-deoxy-L-arabinose transferase-like glycosyltransferase
VLASLFLVTPALLGTLSFARMPPTQRAVAIASMLWIGLSLVVFVVQGRFYAHYAIPLAVPLGILAGLGLQRMAESWGRARSPGRRAMIVLPLATTLAVSLFAGIVSGAMQLTPIQDESGRMDAVAARLRLLPSGTLLVWGNAPRLYDLAGRAPATRYSYMYPLTTPGYTTDAMIEDVARELAADPPEVVVDAGSSAPGQPGFLPLLIDRPIATDGRDLDLLDPLRSFVRERYDLAATVAGWPIYVLRSSQGPAT